MTLYCDEYKNQAIGSFVIDKRSEVIVITLVAPKISNEIRKGKPMSKPNPIDETV